MIENVLKNLVYLYYPKSISFYSDNEKYLKSKEYFRLNNLIKDFESENKEVFSKSILKEFENDITLKDFKDNTLFSWGDRCMTFNIAVVEDGELYTVSLLISIVIPYYVVRCTKNKIDLLYSKSEIDELIASNKETRKLPEIIKKIENVVEDNFFYAKFPDKMVAFVVDDISFQESGFGHFNLFNAFFNNLIINGNED